MGLLRFFSVVPGVLNDDFQLLLFPIGAVLDSEGRIGPTLPGGTNACPRSPTTNLEFCCGRNVLGAVEIREPSVAGPVWGAEAG